MMILKENNSRLTTVSAHVLIWLLLLLFPFVLSSGEPNDFHRVIRYTWVPMFFYALIFYFNHLYFIDRYLFAKKVVVFLAVNFCIILVFTWMLYGIKEFLAIYAPPLPAGTTRPPKMSVQLVVYRDSISMIIPIIISIALKSTQNWTRIVNEKKEIEKENLATELQHLKHQLQPHFFFNSLNTIYSLVEQSPVQAQETIHSLSKLMRYMLYESEADKKSLAEEVDFMKQYINLMKLRLSDKTTVQVNFPALSEHYSVAPLLFISIVENAFKHGVSATQRSDIFFSLTAEGQQIRFFAENTNFPKNGSDKSGSGIGLMNLKKRLELAYPGKHNFKTKVEDKSFSALLEIQIA